MTGIAASAPHAAAAEAGLEILREGGTAIEAMVAMAATISVVYPHMTGLGGDAFWLIAEADGSVRALDASGYAASGATLDLYTGHASIPSRGGLAANTVAGTVAGWAAALVHSATWQHPLPLDRMLEPAVNLARNGITVTASQARNTFDKIEQLVDVPGFADLYVPGGRMPEQGRSFVNPALADTLEHLAEAGLNDFYRGAIAHVLAADLAAAGSPISIADLQDYRAEWREPLAIDSSKGRFFNFPPPTQGLASLAILGIFDRLAATAPESPAWVHALVEATKQAFLVRDAHLADPSLMPIPAETLIAPARLDAMAAGVVMDRALPWPHEAKAGDTVWMGAVDAQGRVVSFIQSLYWEFGSGVVSPQTGIVWQNRGSFFSLDPNSRLCLAPRRKPFHTLNPALVRTTDGRTIAYGTMGGEGQPQTQAALITRHLWHGQPLTEAIAGPRWLLGRTWGSQSTTLKIEADLGPAVIDSLRALGHSIEVVPPLSEMMGHAGAVALQVDGRTLAAADPRSDGAGLVEPLEILGAHPDA